MIVTIAGGWPAEMLQAERVDHADDDVCRDGSDTNMAEEAAVGWTDAAWDWKPYWHERFEAEKDTSAGWSQFRDVGLNAGMCNGWNKQDDAAWQTCVPACKS